MKTWISTEEQFQIKFIDWKKPQTLLEFEE